MIGLRLPSFFGTRKIFEIKASEISFTISIAPLSTNYFTSFDTISDSTALN